MVNFYTEDLMSNQLDIFLPVLEAQRTSITNVTKSIFLNIEGKQITQHITCEFHKGCNGYASNCSSYGLKEQNPNTMNVYIIPLNSKVIKARQSNYLPTHTVAAWKTKIKCTGLHHRLC